MHYELDTLTGPFRFSIILRQRDLNTQILPFPIALTVTVLHAKSQSNKKPQLLSKVTKKKKKRVCTASSSLGTGRNILMRKIRI